MDHLFIALSDDIVAEETKSALMSKTLGENQINVNSKVHAKPPVEPATKWLNFSHDDSRSEKWPLQLDLANYPKIRGWDVESWWEKGDLRRAHSSLSSEKMSAFSVGQQVAAMVQSWLYYGFLEAVLGKTVSTSYLLWHDSDGQPYLHSDGLAFAFMAWKIEIWQMDVAEVQDIYDRTYQNFEVVAAAIQQLLLWTDSGTEPGLWTREHFPGFCEAIIALTPSINRLADVVCMVRDQIHSISGDRMVVMTGLSDAISERQSRLVQRGWCPFLIKYCEIKLHYSVLDWLDGSQMVDTSGGHNLCDEIDCVRNNIDTSTYKPLHFTESCDCTLAAPNLQEVLDIIDAGDTPVMQVIQEPYTQLKVTRQSSKRAGTYVAISHVWVDGLGSTTEAGLPKCQLERLGDLVDKATDTKGASFWIDSLCIPSLKEQRRKSIGLLRNIYQYALKVVVIDRVIQECPENASTERLLWSVVTSPWMQRLWTYQESYLATKVLFSTANQSFLEMDQDLPTSDLPAPSRVVRTSLVQALNTLRPDEGLSADTRQTNIGEVASAVSWRSTSKAGDEVLAIAALLKVDTRKLAEMPASERLRCFFLLVGSLPHDILFFDGPRLSEPFRWAPRTLMSRSSILIDDTNEGQRATATQDGLRGRYLVLRFDEAVRGEDGMSYYAFDATDGVFYSVFWDPFFKNSPDVHFNGIIIRSVQGGLLLKPDLNLVVEGVAILLKESIAEYVGRVTALKRQRDDRAEQAELTFPRILSAQLQMQDLLVT